jgi:uncharacterized protein with PhoU and TrkA domain
MNKMRKDIASLAAKAIRAGVDDAEKWQHILEDATSKTRVRDAAGGQAKRHHGD